MRNFRVKTNSGFWHRTKGRNVLITGMKIANPTTYPELRIFFDTASWDIGREGLIYTDDKFMVGIKHQLGIAGFHNDDFNYSEQGMQGKDYISCDCKPEFVKEFKRVFGKYEIEFHSFTKINKEKVKMWRKMGHK